MTETESRPRNRALVASFLFTDLVGYSKGTASDQYAAKATLSEILGKNLAALSKDDYRIKDTGDGALIAFLSSPEHALYVALAISHDFARAAGVAGFPANCLRTGMHIGAVKEAIDLESRPNFVGDGINAAKRIMDFAAPGQITASRSYFEAVSWLDSAYAALFSHLGASDDKHGRPHELYAIAPSDAVLERLRLELANAAREADALAATNTPPAPPKTAETSTFARSVATAGSAGAARRPRWLLPIIASIVVVLFASIYLGMRPDDSPEATRAAAKEAAPPTGTPAVPPTATKSGRSPDGGTSSTPTQSDATLASDIAPKLDAASDARSADGVSGTTLPATQAPPAAGARATSLGSDTARKAAPGRAAPVPAAAPPASNARCQHLLAKVQIGEPLSQDEKRELTNSCR